MTRRQAHPGPSTKPVLRFNAEGQVVEVRRGHRRITRQKTKRGWTQWSCQHRPYGGGWTKATHHTARWSGGPVGWVLAAFRQPELAWDRRRVWIDAIERMP